MKEANVAFAGGDGALRIPVRVPSCWVFACLCPPQLISSLEAVRIEFESAPRADRTKSGTEPVAWKSLNQ